MFLGWLLNTVLVIVIPITDKRAFYTVIIFSQSIQKIFCENYCRPDYRRVTQKVAVNCAKVRWIVRGRFSHRFPLNRCVKHVLWQLMRVFVKHVSRSYGSKLRSTAVGFGSVSLIG